MRRISITLPNYNSVKYLSRVIDAFLMQDYPNKRMFIVDGKSTDGSHDVIRKYSEIHPEVIWIRQEDRGISNSINISLDYVNEDDVWGYLGADDLLMPGVLGKVCSIFSVAKTANAIYFDSYSLNQDLGSINLRHCPEAEFSTKSLVRHGTIVGLQNIYFDAGLIKKFQFNEDAKYSMDYELYLRLVSAGYKMFIYIPEPSTINIQDGNISNIFFDRANEEALRFAYQWAGLSVPLIGRHIRNHVSKLIKGIAC